MSYAEEMCDIVVDHAGERVRYSAQVDPDDRSQEVLHLRDDLDWTPNREEAVDEELQELLKKGAYESQMGSENVSQIIKVGDSTVMFTGFIEDEMVVVSFERGILAALPGIVQDFRDYMVENGIDFTALSVSPTE